jgi:putative membrane protein
MFADADVAGILNTANQGEIDAANVAVQRATDSRVREFAQRMITDHSNANERLMQIASANNITMSTPSVATQLRSSAAETVETLQQLEGAAFDRTYMDSQVSMHEWTLRMVDEYLIPAASENDLEALLTEIRPTLAQHLESARQIRNGLGSS